VKNAYPLPLIQEFVEGLFGKDVFELLVRPGTTSSKHVDQVPPAASTSFWDII